MVLKALIINLVGTIIIILINVFMIFMINTDTFINSVLNIKRYIDIPINIPKNIKNLNSPLLNLNMEYNKINPLIIQNAISSKHVIKSGVLKLFLRILNTSNNIPIIKPFRMNTIKANA